MRLTFWCLVVVLTLFKDLAEGSCLSYGHSCWGAHGKRSDPSISTTNQNNGHRRLPAMHNVKGASRWALVKITPEKKSRNVLYAPEESVLESMDTPMDEYAATGETRDSLKTRIFNKLYRNGPSASDSNEGVMIRRKLVADNQEQLVGGAVANDSGDELAMSGEDTLPSYINVLKQI